MATLKQADIKKILLDRPGKKIIEAAEAMHKKLSIHMRGIGLADYLDKVETFERPEALLLRKKYAKSNKDLFERLTNPVNKVFAARGGSRYFPGAADQISIGMAGLLKDVEHGYNSKKWVETFWKPRYFDDPMAIILMEVGQGDTYPTYKASTDIFDYKLAGRKLDWLVLRTEDKEVFRVIDDTMDVLYKLSGDTVRKVGETYVNYFGYVPALVVSDIPKSGMVDLFESPFDGVVELADDYLRDGSIRTIYKFKHGFPKAWKYREMCGDCKGTGMLHGSTCNSCNGTGKKMDSTVADMMVLDWPTANDQVIAPDVAGYITPDLEYLKYGREEMGALEALMFRTHWGTYQSEQRTAGEADTATAKFHDVQPINDRLNAYADAAEEMEKFIVDAIGQFHYGRGYTEAKVSYGRRFMLEGPDVIWRKYEQARKMGAPQGTLDEHLIEYYEAKFQANPLEMARYLRMMKIEPFVHLTVKEAFEVVGDDEFARKLYFSEWRATIKDFEWLTKSDEFLKDSLSAFSVLRFEPKTDPAAQMGAAADPNNLIGAGGADNVDKGKKSKTKNPDGTPNGVPALK